MLVIYSANAAKVTGGEDLQKLSELLRRYDHAATDGERESAASGIEKIIGGRVRSMLVRAASGRPLDSSDLAALATEATHAALRELQPRFRRSDAAYGDWTPVIEKLREATNAPARKIWSLIPAETRKAVSKLYVKATEQDGFILALNQHVLPRRDLYDQSWVGVNLPEEASTLLARGTHNLSNSEVMRLNILLLQSLFPGEIANAAPLRANPADDIFRILPFVIKRLKPQVWAAAGSAASPYDVDAWSLIKPSVEELNRIEAGQESPPADATNWGTMNRADRVQFLYRERLKREYGEKVAWWDKKIAEFGGDWRLTDDSSYRSATELFRRHHVPQALYARKGSPYWFPSSVFKPIGLQTIGRLLSTPGFGISMRAPAAIPKQVAAQPEAEMPQFQQQRPVGRLEYEQIANNIFSRPGYELERAVALFLAANPQPAQQQVDRFINELPPELGETARDVGFRNISREVDEKMLEALQRPEFQRTPQQQGRQPALAQLAPSLEEPMEAGGAVPDDPLFGYAVDLLYPPQSLERLVGRWLQHHPTPTLAQLDSLEDMLSGEMRAQMSGRDMGDVTADIWALTDKFLAAINSDPELRRRMERRLCNLNLSEPLGQAA